MSDGKLSEKVRKKGGKNKGNAKNMISLTIFNKCMYKVYCTNIHSIFFFTGTFRLTLFFLHTKPMKPN